MASSSNRHWPSMFKSKPSCNTHHHHEWRSHDSNNLLSSTTACHRSALTTSGCEERSPEPKPRWNPKPEQIRILESIFNSGMVNPPRDEIRKIRAQLQEYGQVGDANVFYWFQNRKSRSKLHKSRHLLKSQATIATATATATTTATTSSSSSEKSKSSVDLILKSPTASVDQQPQPYFQEPLFFTTLQPPTTEGFCFSKLGNVFNPHQTVGSDLLIMNIQQNGILNSNYFKSHVEQDKMMKMSTAFTPTCIVPPNLNPTTTTLPSTITDFQGMEEPGPRKSTVFINDVAFEVTVGPFNVREAFGDDAVLVHSYGQPMLTNDCGVTLQPLQHGAFYYLVRSLSYDRSNAIDVI